jgi:hypothetical protein
MTNDSHKPKTNPNQSEDTKEMKALAKAMMVHLTWSMAAMPQQKPSKQPEQHPPHSDN